MFSYRAIQGAWRKGKERGFLWARTCGKLDDKEWTDMKRANCWKMALVSVSLAFAGLATTASGDDSRFMVVDLSGGPEAATWPVSWMDSMPGSGWTDIYKTTKMVLRRIDPGAFLMGGSGEFAKSDERLHNVLVSHPFYIGVFEVTQRQFELITGYNPSQYYGGTRPVESISYDNIRGPNAGSGWPGDRAVDGDSVLGLLRAKTGIEFDLPSEAQWEYACRAGTQTDLNSGHNLTNDTRDSLMITVGRYYYHMGQTDRHARVGLYAPNAWGLYDMHGNVYEYCLDWYGDYPASGFVLEFAGPDTGTKRLARGGSWGCNAAWCRSAYRRTVSPGTGTFYGGFRVSYTTDKAELYLIRYNANGGNEEDSFQYATNGTSVTLSPCPFSKAFSAFAGWGTTPEGPVRYAAGETIPSLQTDADLTATLYAIWQPLQTVIFDPNGGQCDTRRKTYTVGQTYGSLPIPTREHHVFAGWWTATEGGEQVKVESMVTESGYRNLYARWTLVEHVVTFAPDGGTCPVTNYTYTVGEPYSFLPSATLEHYAADWYTDLRGGELVTESTLVPSEEYQTLYAHWRRVDQIVTFDPNGGTCSSENQIQTIGQPYTSLPSATLEHYALSGWFTERDGGDRVDGTIVPATDTRILYAHWTLVEQVATFNPNGGTCPVTERTYIVGQPYASLPVAALEHYAAQWYTVPTGGDPVTEATIVPATEYQTFHARWTRTEQIVTYDPNGGSCGTETQIQTIGQPYATLPSASREHYVLAGWYTAPDGGDLVDETTTVTAADTRTLYAHWTRVDQIVTFDPNGGSCDTDYRIYTIGQPYASLPTATLEHYALAGWYTAPAGGDLVDGTTTVTAADTRTLYAHWTRVDQIVTFDPNGGSCDTGCQIYTIGQPYAFLPDATLEKHGFEGWYTHCSGGERVDITNIVSAIDTLNLYAQWSPIQVVAFDANGGSCSTETKEYRIGKTMVGCLFPSHREEDMLSMVGLRSKGSALGNQQRFYQLSLCS